MKLGLLKFYTTGFVLLLLISALFYSCKKETFITFEGRLLLSSSNPVPVSNYKISFYQAGSPGIPIAIYSSPSEAFTTTDNNGNYRVKFKTGNSGFIVFQGSNTNSIDMMGEPSANFSGFMIRNIPGNGGTVYLHKKINSATLLLSAVNSGIAPGDSLFIDYNSTTGHVDKAITGITVAQGTNSFTLDIINDLALAFYDFTGKSYQNDVVIKLKKAGQTYTQYINPPLGESIPPGDETNRQLSFYLL